MYNALSGAATTLGGAAAGAVAKPKIWGAVIGAVGGILGGMGQSRAAEKQNAAQIASQERMARENREFEERMRKEDIQRKRDAVGKYKGFYMGGDGMAAKPAQKPIPAGLGNGVRGAEPQVAAGGGGNSQQAMLLRSMQSY